MLIINRGGQGSQTAFHTFGWSWEDPCGCLHSLVIRGETSIFLGRRFSKKEGEGWKESEKEGGVRSVESGIGSGRRSEKPDSKSRLGTTRGGQKICRRGG